MVITIKTKFNIVGKQNRRRNRNNRKQIAMNNSGINEIVRNDQYAKDILAGMNKSILLANSEQASYETRKQHIIDALLILFKANYSITVKNSAEIQFEFTTTLIVLAKTVKKYRLDINRADLGIELINDIANQICSDLITRLILKDI